MKLLIVRYVALESRQIRSISIIINYNFFYRRVLSHTWSEAFRNHRFPIAWKSVR